jgi:hypothetical protein
MPEQPLPRYGTGVRSAIGTRISCAHHGLLRFATPYLVCNYQSHY